MSKLEKNLTEGNVVKQLLMFALPFMLSNLVQSLYNVADMLIVGRYNGAIGISGVNIGGQVTFLMTNIVIGLCTGATVVIAQYLGIDDKKAIKETMGTLLTTLLVVGIFLSALMLIISTPILHLMKTPEESFMEARGYLDITILGTLFIFGYNALSAVMRGMGDSRRPLYFVTIACVCNIALDFLLVGGLHMGARGAAIATVISQGLSMALCIIYLKRNDFVFDFKLSSFRFHQERLNILLKIGIPTSIQNVINNLSFLVMTAVVNDFGVMASAAVGVVGKFNSFAILPGIAVGSSISAMAAQNIGAGRNDRARHTLKTGLVLANCISIPIFLLAFFFPEPIIRVFSDEPEMIQAGAVYMGTFCFDYLLAPCVFCIAGIITGAGHTKVSSTISILSAVGLRIPIAILCGTVLDMGLSGVGLGAPLASGGALLFALYYYLSGKWETSAVLSLG